MNLLVCNSLSNLYSLSVSSIPVLHRMAVLIAFEGWRQHHHSPTCIHMQVFFSDLGHVLPGLEPGDPRPVPSAAGTG